MECPLGAMLATAPAIPAALTAPAAPAAPAAVADSYAGRWRLWNSIGLGQVMCNTMELVTCLTSKW